MKKGIIFLVILIAAAGLGAWFLAREIFCDQVGSEGAAAAQGENGAIYKLLEARRAEAEKNGTVNPFDEKGTVRVLFIGLDQRAGQTDGHCDAIQFITIDKEKGEVTITAVPRGTYSPLPRGGKYLPSDYYVSNACAVGGLDYGIEQIEKIVGQKADYLVVLGFSEALGIFRNLNLPTMETLQWLRHRQGYAVGEPQRAHNHSTFLKQMMIKYIPEKSSTIDRALQYIMYKTVKTDLSFAEARKIADELGGMNLAKNTEKIKLSMRPTYAVQDIPYAEEYLGEYLNKMIDPIKHLLPDKDYSGLSEEEAQVKLLEIIEEKKEDLEFVAWAFNNNIWLQIEDKETRLVCQYDFLERYLTTLSEKSQRENIIADYILEMEYYEKIDWVEKGKNLLKKEIGQ